MIFGGGIYSALFIARINTRAGSKIYFAIIKK